MANRNRDLARERTWRGRLARQAASGLSVRAFCQRERLSEASFYAWRRTISQRDGEGKPVLRRPAFVPAVLTGSVLTGSAVTIEPRREETIQIELAGGRLLRLPDSMEASRLAELVLALEARAAQ